MEVVFIKFACGSKSYIDCNSYESRKKGEGKIIIKKYVAPFCAHDKSFFSPKVQMIKSVEIRKIN